MSYSCNDNQNYFTEAGRTTSKVLRPPGGGSSISLAYDAPEQNNQNNYVSANLARRNKKNQEITGKIGAAQPQQMQQPHGMQQQQQQYSAAQAAYGNITTNPADHNHNHLGLNVGGNAFANGANQNCGNVITDRSSTRIHAPPGGHSSITFG
mmetsp:Transcript_18387/g.38283  ORF Transcript_18387/g.38283 Transcript_18387/m.38283 type:complete len:152 (+) Transcript_18387:39-494(+)|eukprot:CAMPEP_0118654766 /NCGR_PEP_ID=MMETSP0785-20121206/12566_1 /TAXON_ID=91992 /ORGANISM="Bolidomonas pacifica, Strain CCMP 1866" /LENGTH=151 /DNA_ID=CAMNT_0006547451 /DNA_START=41 /DNA_END=496 /DNA_ORIENTATION=-